MFSSVEDEKCFIPLGPDSQTEKVKLYEQWLVKLIYSHHITTFLDQQTTDYGSINKDSNQMQPGLTVA